jgi:hypothetical protein
MIGSSILSQIDRFKATIKRLTDVQKTYRPDLHTASLERSHLPNFVQRSALVNRYLDLLGPLDWGLLPERDLERNWGQVTIPYAAFIAAYLIKLNEGQNSVGDLRLFMSENPALAWLVGFPGTVSNPGQGGYGISANDLPTIRHLTHMLRKLPQPVLQFLLGDTVHLIRQELSELGVASGECISLDTKHILAWVKENNPKAYVEERFDKTKQPAGDPDCKLGCKRRHNRRKKGAEVEKTTTPNKNPIPAEDRSVGEFYWGYGSGVVVTKVPGWGEFILAEMTQTFDKGDATYFFPLMAVTEQRLGFRPRYGTFDAAFDAWYVYDYFHREDDLVAFAAVPFSEKGGYKAKGRQFSSEGLPLCAAGLPMPLLFTFKDTTTCLVEHQRGKYGCPLRYPQTSENTCPVNHKNWAKKGCIAMMPTSIGARLRYTLDRDGQVYKDIYKQRTAVERINSQAKALGIERPYLRNGAAIANQNTLIYILINLRFLQRIRNHQPEMD